MARIRIELETEVAVSDSFPMTLARAAAEAGKNGTGRPVKVTVAEVVREKVKSSGR